MKSFLSKADSEDSDAMDVMHLSVRLLSEGAADICKIKWAEMAAVYLIVRLLRTLGLP